MAKAKVKAVPGDNVLGAVGGYVERIERLEEEKKGIATDIKDIYGEAKDHGLSVPGLRRLIAKRKKDKEKEAELDRLVALYEAALKRAAQSATEKKHEFEGPG